MSLAVGGVRADGQLVPEHRLTLQPSAWEGGGEGEGEGEGGDGINSML